MAGRSDVFALAAWAAPIGGESETGRSTPSEPGSRPFRSAIFDEPSGAISAALLLMSAVPHGDEAAITIAIAVGEPDAARAESDALASHGSAGSILLTPGTVEAVGHRLPAGMALRATSVTTDQGMRRVFELRSAAEIVPHALPTPTTRLIGRASELHALQELLVAHRLITLAGPPGSGKTRLAIELGRSALGTFPDGAWFVPLAPLQDDRLVANAVARTLDLSEQPGTPMRDVVRQHLASRRLLLILDNFEHLLQGASVVGEWLAAAPDVRILVTSREPLHLSGEWEFEVRPLRVPSDADDPGAADAEAVQLFAERARAVDARFEIDRQTLRDVVGICRRLDGLPLAVELAAARAKALPVASIRGRLEQSMELLTQGARDIPEHHRSLRAAVSWSHDLLAPAEQAFFRRLSAFRGGWSLDAAEAVAAVEELGQGVLDLTTSLVDKSLIQRRGEVRREPRYEMLEVIREYASEQLAVAGEIEQTAERHAGWFVDLAEQAAPMLTGRDRGEWLDRLELELNNLRAAMRWAIDRHRVELGMRLAAALWRFWQIRAHIGEGRQTVAELLALEVEDVDPAIRARALSAAGSLAYWQNDARACTEAYEASLALRRKLPDPLELASSLYDLGHAISCVAAVKDPKRGRALEMEALDIYRANGSAVGEAWLLWALGCNWHFAGDNQRAAAELASAVEHFRGLDDPFGLAWALTMHGLAVYQVGQWTLAGQQFREALPIFAEVDDVSGMDSVLEHLARLAAAYGDPRRAVRLAAAAARIRGISESAIMLMVYAGQPEGSTPLMLDRDNLQLTPDEVAAASREGEVMTTAEAVAYALEQEAMPSVGLRLQVLGPMQVDRGAERVRRWGGDKAGSRQAQAIFAFLFDRGESGVTKDEAVELLWPDLPIKRGDLAFHRTLGGLRSVLGESGLSDTAITFEGGRYRLAPTVVSWSDVTAFEGLLERASDLGGAERLATLEQARELYRGDLFDDCPFYGDSAFVEDRREYLRGRYEDLLVELGDRYAEAGDPAQAGARYRQALAVNPDNARAAVAIQRLAAVVGEA